MSALLPILFPAQKRDHDEFGTSIWIETYMGMDNRGLVYNCSYHYFLCSNSTLFVFLVYIQNCRITA
jgi:hypothetical protein